jgi:hypothetical protein
VPKIDDDLCWVRIFSGRPQGSNFANLIGPDLSGANERW